MILQGYQPSATLSCCTCIHSLAARAPLRLWRQHRQPIIKQQRVLSCTAQQQSVTKQHSTAKMAVEAGLRAFNEGRVSEALELFQQGLQLQPSDDEARAALYNSACCYTRQKEWRKAADAVMRACNEYSLKFSVAAQDPDLKQLRDTREWLDVLESVRGGVSQSGLVNLRSEAKAPFRLVRMLLVGTVAAAAAVSLVITLARLAPALQGGDDAPQLTGVLQNLAINGAGLAVTGFLLKRDLDARERDKRVVAREESLARLQIQLPGNRLLPLANFRGTVRPVLLAGTKGQIQKAIKAADPYKEELRTRGVSLVPLPTTDENFNDRISALKQEFSASSESKGFAQRATPKASKPKQVKEASKQEKDKFQLEPYDVSEWLAWVAEQKKAANVKGNELVYVQVQLDGTVRASGLGIPPWMKFLDDIPPLDDVRTRFTDGIGTSR